MPEPPSVDSIREVLVKRVATELGVEETEIDIHESLFAHGIDSMAAVTLCAEVEDLLEIDLPGSAVWDYPTIDALSRYMLSEWTAAHGSPGAEGQERPARDG